MTQETFTGASLEKALREGALDSSRTATMVGMAKPSDEAGYISFTRSGCDNWIDLPVEMIQSAEKIGDAPCRDHSHPLVKITLEKPQDKRQQVLLALLADTAPTQPGPTGAPFAGALEPSIGGGPFDVGMPGALAAAPGNPQDIGCFGGFCIRCFYYGPFIGRWCCLYFNGRLISCTNMQVGSTTSTDVLRL